MLILFYILDVPSSAELVVEQVGVELFLQTDGYKLLLVQ